MTAKLNKYLACSICGAGVVANSIGLLSKTYALYKSSDRSFFSIFGWAITLLSLFNIIILTIPFFKRKNYIGYVITMIVITASISFPLILITSHGVFAFYLSMMGSAAGLLALKDWRFSISFAAFTLLEYATIIFFNGPEWWPNYWVNYLSGICASFMFAELSTMLCLTALKTSNKRLSKEAEHDQLTTVYNRYKLEQDFNTGLYKYAAMIDIDFFKKVNDTYGHKAGDRALVQLSQSLLRYVTDDFRCYRFGGEEFLILCRTDEKDFLERLSMLWEDLEFTFFLRQGEKLTVSIGAVYSENKDLLIKSADDNLYKAKNNGRHQAWYNNHRII